MTVAQVEQEREWLRIAYAAALKSPDPSTQNGAVLVDPIGRRPLMVTLACNEFPRGVKYNDERWERPTKYSFIEHAERNALFLAARVGIPTVGAILVCPWAACADCVRAIAQCGIQELIRHEPNDVATNERWRDSCEKGDRIMLEGGVVLTNIRGSFGDVAPIRRDGRLHQP